MALTKDFRETVRERLQRDPKARKALLVEAIECLLAGDVDTGKAVLRNYSTQRSALRNSATGHTSPPRA